MSGGGLPRETTSCKGRSRAGLPTGPAGWAHSLRTRPLPLAAWNMARSWAAAEAKTEPPREIQGPPRPPLQTPRLPGRRPCPSRCPGGSSPCSQAQAFGTPCPLLLLCARGRKPSGDPHRAAGEPLRHGSGPWGLCQDRGAGAPPSPFHNAGWEEGILEGTENNWLFQIPYI